MMIREKFYKNIKYGIVYDEFAENPMNYSEVKIISTIDAVNNDIHLKLRDLDDEHTRSDFENKNHIKPLYCYNHSGMKFSTTPFNCAFDSGKVGYIYIDKELFDVDFICTIDELFDMTLDELNSYISGEVYRIKVYDCEDNMLVSCGGHYGTEEEVMKEAKEDAKREYECSIINIKCVKDEVCFVDCEDTIYTYEGENCIEYTRTETKTNLRLLVFNDETIGRIHKDYVDKINATPLKIIEK